jgi:hypothetical protein
LTTGKESRQIAAEEHPKTKKPAATTGVTAGSIVCEVPSRREPHEAEPDARVTQPEKAMDGFFRVTPSRTLGSPSLKRPWMAFQA